MYVQVIILVPGGIMYVQVIILVPGGIMYVQVIILVPRGYHVCTSYNISSPGVSCMHKL